MVFRVIVLDSSYLVSFFMQDDANHNKAVEISKKAAIDELVLPDLILYETLTVLNYEGGIALAKEAYEKMLGSRQMRFLPLNELEKKEILLEFFSQKTKLSFEDSVVIYLARKTASRVFAFDKKILALAREPTASQETDNWDSLIELIKERDKNFRGKRRKIDHDLILYGASRKSKRKKRN